MAHAACASTTCAPSPRPFTLPAPRTQDRGTSFTYHSSLATQHCNSLIGSSAIRNRRNPLKQHVMSFSNRSRISCLRAPFVHVLYSTTDQLHRTSHPFLISSAPGLENELTRSQQTRKYFLIASFSTCLAHASHLDALTTLHPSPTMKSMPCILPQDAFHFTAVADRGSLITDHHSLITGYQNV
jgi:hypothetical protein